MLHLDCVRASAHCISENPVKAGIRHMPCLMQLLRKEHSSCNCITQMRIYRPALSTAAKPHRRQGRSPAACRNSVKALFMALVGKAYWVLWRRRRMTCFLLVHSRSQVRSMVNSCARNWPCAPSHLKAPHAVQTRSVLEFLCAQTSSLQTFPPRTQSALMLPCPR